MSRRELFRKAEEEKQKEEESKKGFKREFDNLDYVALIPDVELPIRIIGNPIHVRENYWDPIVFQSSQILDDKGDLFHCTWPMDDPNWVLWRIYKLVMAYDYEEATKTKHYKLASKYPALFNRIHKNNKLDSPYEQGWKPSKSVLMNVLDRSDMAWHKENKKFKLLSRNVGTSKKDPNLKFYDKGFPYSVYEMVFNQILEENGDWEDYDIVIERFSKKKADQWYAVRSFYEPKKISDDVFKLMSDKPLTDEEKSWEKYDVSKYVKVTSYTKILNRLGKFLKEVDASLGKNFYEEVKEASDKEKEEWKKNGESNEDHSEGHSESKTTESKSEPETKKEEVPKTRERAKTSPKEEENLDMFALAKKEGWKGIDKLSDEERALIKVINPSKNEIFYLDTDGEDESDDELVDCEICGLKNSFKVSVCCKCGTKYS